MADALTREKLYENTTRGDLLFPFQHYEMTTDNCNIFVPYHWHDETEIILVMEGQVALLLDGVNYLLDEGDIAFINAKQLHQFTSLTSKLVYYAYVFPMGSLQFSKEDITQTSILEPLFRQELCFPPTLSQTAACYASVRDLIRQIISSNERHEESYQLLTKAYLYEIIGLLSQNNLLTRKLRPSRELDTCRRILLYIQEHYAEPISIRSISAYLCMSSNYFSAYFTRHFGRGFVDFLTHYRIEKACVLLASGDINVTQAALQTGFENISYFIKKFKLVTGTTPAAYKRKTAALPKDVYT